MAVPEADGSPAAGAAVTASVRIDGDDRVFDSQEGIPAAGSCDDDGCRVGIRLRERTSTCLLRNLLYRQRASRL
jgi:hypothetical protein